MNTAHNTSIIVAGLLIAIGLTFVSNSLDKQTTQAEVSLAWGQKLDCYWLVENEAREGKHTTFNMEECDY